jgi:hypothetical protein
MSVIGALVLTWRDVVPLGQKWRTHDPRKSLLVPLKGASISWIIRGRDSSFSACSRFLVRCHQKSRTHTFTFNRKHPRFSYLRKWICLRECLHPLGRSSRLCRFNVGGLLSCSVANRNLSHSWTTCSSRQDSWQLYLARWAKVRAQAAYCSH